MIDIEKLAQTVVTQQMTIEAILTTSEAHQKTIQYLKDALQQTMKRVAPLSGDLHIVVPYEGRKPERATPGSGAYDLHAAFEEDEIAIQPNMIAQVPIALKTAIPPGYVGLLCSRSGTGVRKLNVINRPGIIDSDFRGEWKAFLHNEDVHPFVIHRGDRVAQVVIVRAFEVEWIEAESGLDDTERGNRGFGSTGL